MARGRSDIANTSIRIFLQDVGEEYDRARGFEPWNVKRHFPEVIDFFGGRCCYCAIEFDATAKANQDHLIPINRTDLGLDAWGNIVPACAACNNKRQRTDWRAFVIQRAGPAAGDRHARVEEFLAAYKYSPNFDLRSLSEELYEEVGEIAIKIVELKLRRFRQQLK